MNGHTVRRGKGRWALVLESKDEQGRRKQRWRSFKGNKDQADQELRRLLVAADEGRAIEPAKMTVNQLVTHWMEAYASTNVRARTKAGYEGVARRYIAPNIGAVPIAKLTPAHVQGLYSKLLLQGLSARTVLSAHRLLREVLHQAVRWELLVRNVCDQVDPPRPQHKDMRTLDTDQAIDFLSRVQDKPLGHMFALALHTGMRRSELCGVRWKDVDLDAGFLSVTQALIRIPHGGLQFFEPKTKRSRRRIALAPGIVAALRRHRANQAAQRLRLGSAWKDHGVVFARPDGRPLDPDEVSHAFKKIMHEMDTGSVRLHDLRHSFASLALANGEHPKVVSDILGHATISITLDLYSHVLPGMQEQTALRLEQRLTRKPAVANG